MGNTEQPENTLGSNLRRIRKENKLTQSQLAKLSGLSVSYLSSIERGERTASLKTLKKIGKALKVPVYVLTGDNPVDPDDYDPRNELTDLNSLQEWVKKQPVLFLNGQEVPKEVRQFFEDFLEMVIDNVKKKQKKTPEKELIT